ncbi:MAG: hypothetical protein ACF8R7_14605 [Phycisphaerales bacterium JB039]
MRRRALMVVAACAGLASSLCAQEAAEGDFASQIAALAAARHEGNRNGWAELSRAIALKHELMEAADARHAAAGAGEHPSVVAGELGAGPLPRDGVEGGLWYIDRARELGVFDALGDFAEIGQAWQPIDQAEPVDPMMTQRLDTSSTIRELARICRAAMRLAAVEGDADAQVARFDELLALAGATADRLLIVDRLVAAARVALATEEARCQTVEGLIDAETARRMLALIDHRLPLAPLSATRRAETLYAAAMTLEMLPADWPDAQREQFVAGLLEAVRAEQAADAPDPADMEDPPEQPEDLIPFLAQTIRDSLTQAERIEPIIALHTDGARIALALEVYRAAEGAYPDGLDALAPQILPALPADPFTQAPFGYRRLEAPDEHGRAYLLWSAGADGADNGGRTHAEGSYMALQDRGAGFDFVLNDPRRPAPAP